MATATRSVYRIMFPGLILGVLSFLILMFLGDPSLISAYFVSFKWQYFALALGFNLLYHFLRFQKQNFHLGQSGFKSFSVAQRVKHFLSGIVLSASPLRVSESYRSVWLNQASGIPLNTADSLHLIDRLSDILSVLVLAIAGSLAFPSFIPFFLLVFILFLATTFSLKINPANIKNGKSIQSLKLVSQQIRHYVESNPKAFSIFSMTVSLTLGILSWLSLGAALFSILIGLGLQASLVLIAIACLVLSFSMLMGLVSNLPGGLGVIELAIAALLTILLNFQPELAVAATILFRLATFWIDLLFGILFWSLMTKPQPQSQKAGHIVKG